MWCLVIVLFFATPVLNSNNIEMQEFDVLLGKGQAAINTNIGSTQARSKVHCGALCTQTPTCQLATFIETSAASEHNCVLGSCVAGQLQAQINAITLRVKDPLPRNPVDCKDWRDAGCFLDEVYPISIGGAATEVDVVCDMTSEGGGWTVFQQRRDGSVDFNRGWNEFLSTFGDVELGGNYWLGLEIIHQLTNYETVELLVQLTRVDGGKRYARYSIFDVGDASGEYVLNVGGYSGNSGDSMAASNGWPFSTTDNDNHNPTCSRDCLTVYASAWWFGCCSNSILNGIYSTTPLPDYNKAITWWASQRDTVLIQTTMLVRSLG